MQAGKGDGVAATPAATGEFSPLCVNPPAGATAGAQLGEACAGMEHPTGDASPAPCCCCACACAELLAGAPERAGLPAHPEPCRERVRPPAGLNLSRCRSGPGQPAWLAAAAEACAGCVVVRVVACTGGTWGRGLNSTAVITVSAAWPLVSPGLCSGSPHSSKSSLRVGELLLLRGCDAVEEARV